MENNGNFRTLLQLQNDTILSVIYDQEKIHVGTGEDGEIYTVHAASGMIEKNFRLNTAQISCFARMEKNIIFATGSSSGIYELAPRYHTAGKFTSRIFDARGLAVWGKIEACEEEAAGAQTVFFTRSGNTFLPGEEWEEWKETSGRRILSRAGRFIQYRLELTAGKDGTTPSAGDIRVFYQIANRPPAVKNIFFGRDSEFEKVRKQAFKPGEYAVRWDAFDPDNDPLEFSVSCRQKNQPWFVLEKKSREPFLVIDSYRLPQGKYEFMVQARDLPANTLETAFSVSNISRYFIIDNEAPEIRLESFQDDIALIRITDSLSVLSIAEISSHLSDFTAIGPVDGVLDSGSEQFRYNAAQAGYIHVRARDEHNNIAFKTIRLEKK
ncbi:MAG TPA: hypothetical protein DC049_19295 [Spirochaetia bacterium]|nr:hypothetical protein [Spirochaetia bacterium]